MSGFERPDQWIGRSGPGAQDDAASGDTGAYSRFGVFLDLGWRRRTSDDRRPDRRSRPAGLGQHHLLNAMNRLLAVLMFCVLGILVPKALPASATLPVSEEWAMLQTENFTLFSNLDEGGVRAIGGNLEQLRGALVQELGDAAVEVPVPTLLYVFRDGESFAPFALPSGGSGFFMPHIHANFAAVVASDVAEATPVVYRQYVGELIRSQVPQSPLWHRYGLAELLSTFTVEGTVARIGLPPERSATLLEDASMGLDELLSARKMPPDAESAAAFSARAWGLVHYLLVADPERRQKTRAWVNELVENEALGDAFLETYGTGGDALEQKLAAYLQSDPPPELRVELEKTAGTDGRFVRLSPPDALVTLADLLLHTQPAKQAAARELLDAARKLAPENFAVTAAEGFLAEQAGDLAGAGKLYARALESFEEDRIARDRDGFRIYFYSAEAELSLLAEKRPRTEAERDRLGRAVAALERCVELREGYGEAWARLGYAPKPFGRFPGARRSLPSNGPTTCCRRARTWPTTCCWPTPELAIGSERGAWSILWRTAARATRPWPTLTRFSCKIRLQLGGRPDSAGADRGGGRVARADPGREHESGPPATGRRADGPESEAVEERLKASRPGCCRCPRRSQRSPLPDRQHRARSCWSSAREDSPEPASRRFPRSVVGQLPESLSGRIVTVGQRVVDRGVAVGVHEVGIGPAAQQRANDVDLSFTSGKHQRRPRFAVVDRVRVGAAREQELDGFGESAGRGVHECGTSDRIAI